MSSQTSSTAAAVAPCVTIAFPQKFSSSPQFRALFDEGMQLVEDTANYLDGAGRAESRRLKNPLSVAYATESMRLTTRLMQIASWLLVRRAVNRGELSEEAAASAKHKVSLMPIGRSTPTKGYDELPSELRSLIEASVRLHERVIRLDRAIHGDGRAADEQKGPLDDHIRRIRSVFSAGE